MQQKQYRFNRKFGKIYLDQNNFLKEVGTELNLIILAASEPIYAQPFEHLCRQSWVKLCFLDEAGDWGYGLLGSGMSDALTPWFNYCRILQHHQCSLSSVITTLSFEPIEGGQWHDFHFRGKPGKPGLAQRIQKLIENPPFPLVNPAWNW